MTYRDIIYSIIERIVPLRPNDRTWRAAYLHRYIHTHTARALGECVNNCTNKSYKMKGRKTNEIIRVDDRIYVILIYHTRISRNDVA